MSYSSGSKITSGIPSPVVICVPSYLLAPRLCPDESNQTYEYSTIEATIVDVQTSPGNCGSPTTYNYTICFDADLVAEGQTISQKDITGLVDLGCLKQYIDDKVGNEPVITENEDGSLTYTSPHGCAFTFFPGEAPVAVILDQYRNIDLKNIGQVVKATPGIIHGFYIFNLSATILFLKIYDTSGVPTIADTPVKTLPIPPDNKGAVVDWAIGRPFDNGISIRATTGVLDSDNGAPGDNEVIVNIDYV